MQFSLVSVNTIAALAFAVTAIGIIIQILAGVVTTKIPAGAIILLVIAICTIVRAADWWPAVGVVVSIGIFIGGLIAGGMFDRLGSLDHLGPFIGTAMQLLGIAVGVIAGIIAILTNYAK